MDAIEYLKNSLILLSGKDEEEKERKECMIESLNDLNRKFQKDKETFGNKSNNTTIPQFFWMLKESVLAHRWIEVLKSLQYLSINVASAPLVFQKLSLEVFYQEPKSVLMFQKFVKQIKIVKDYDDHELVLDYFLFVLLSTQQEYDAALQVKPHNKKGLKTGNQLKYKYHENLRKAYIALSQYIDWFKTKEKIEVAVKLKEGLENEHSVDDELADDVASLESIFDRVLPYFYECIEHDGTWDVFVCKLLEMMTYHNKVEEACSVAEHYASKNGGNPYALKLLYEFYSLHHYSSEKRYNILKKICDLDKGGDCLKEFYSLSKEMNKGSVATLPLIFTLLDYPKWKNSEEIWSLMVSDLIALHNKGEVDVIYKEWEDRSDWWIPYHFHFLPETSQQLLFMKTMAALFLLSYDAKYVQAVITSGTLSQENLSSIQKWIEKLQ